MDGAGLFVPHSPHFRWGSNSQSADDDDDDITRRGRRLRGSMVAAMVLLARKVHRISSGLKSHSARLSERLQQTSRTTQSSATTIEYEPSIVVRAPSDPETMPETESGV